CCGGCGGCNGCYGGCNGCCGGCNGGFGYNGGFGGVPAATSYPTGGLAPVPVAAPLRNQATVVVGLPAQAKLYVDGQEANLTSDRRSFTTPELDANRDYYYTLKAIAQSKGET